MIDLLHHLSFQNCIVISPSATATGLLKSCIGTQLE